MIVSSASTLADLRRTRPEWAGWLDVLDEVMRESHAPRWERAIPAPDARRDRRPLLDGSSVSVRSGSVRGWLERVLRLASTNGQDGMRSLATLQPSESDAVALFASSIRHDSEAARRAAATHDADAEALQAVVALLPVPFLLACNRRLAASVPASWTESYCPICGSWPAFAEIRGIERSRCFRCGRCGSEWAARALACVFCGTTDHGELTTLVPGKNGVSAVVDACNRCRGYVKAFTRLQGCAPAAVMSEDLASVDLDMAALDGGYARPAGAGYPAGVMVTDNARRRIFGWNS